MLQGKQVALRAVEKDDAESIKEWLSDPELLHLLGARPIPIGNVDPEKLPEMFRLRDGRVLAILTREKRLIGLVAFGNVHEYNRTATLLLAIGDRGEWNRGNGTDALRTALHFAFEDLNLNCVEAHIPQFNQRALRVFQKVGFQIEGTLRSRFYGRGKYWDLVAASAVRSSWTGEAVQAPAPAVAQQPQAPPEPSVAAPSWQPQTNGPPAAPAPPAYPGSTQNS